MVITVDPVAGDTCEEFSDCFKFRLAAQQSPLDPDIVLPEEINTVLLRNVFQIKRRKRVVTPPTPEQKQELQRWVKDIVNRSSQQVRL